MGRKRLRTTARLTAYEGDQIYETNKNRKFATTNGIATCFKKKRRDSKIEHQKSAMIKALGTAEDLRFFRQFIIKKK